MTSHNAFGIQPTVVHLIPHLGGGAGKVLQTLVGWLAESSPFSHQVFTFESVHPTSKAWASRVGVELHDAVSPDATWLHDRVMAADVAHLHFWNHPTNWHFMRAFSGKPARLLAWSYVNGVNAPQYIPQQARDFFEYFVTSSLFSLQNPHVQQGMMTGACRHIFMSAGYDSLDTVRHQVQPRFTAGYIGTVDYCKVHPQFLDACHALCSNNIDVTVCGGPSYQALDAEYHQRFGAVPTTGTVRFLGQVADIANVLSQLDVLFYPLAPGNYGTGEQVLIEALAAGVPQVVLSGGPEACVVRDAETAVVVDTVAHMSSAIVALQNDRARLQRFSAQSRALARECYPLEQTGRQWQALYEDSLSKPRLVRELSCVPVEPWPVALFLTALGDTHEGAVFARAFAELPDVSVNCLRQLAALPAICTSKTRGSIFHYAATFPACTLLQQLAEIMNHTDHRGTDNEF